MILFLISYISGVLTILAPCVLPVLPVILGSSAVPPRRDRAWRIIGAFAVSIFVFTLALKASTALIDIPPEFLKGVSASILIGYGIVTLFPTWWEYLMSKLPFQQRAETQLYHAQRDDTYWSDIGVGAALGPVFTTCSPTYSLILATIFPVSLIHGIIYLVAYIAGFCSILILISYFGITLIKRLRWLANPTGMFRKVLGVTFICIGIILWMGIDKKIQTVVLDAGFFDITKVEERLLRTQQIESPPVQDGINVDPNAPLMSTKRAGSAPEIAGITQWLNTAGKPVTLAELKGKVVIVDFWTYSCINCQRTLPYLKKWHQKYAEKGLVILGIHAPEFAFEHKIENVSKAVGELGVTYPVGLDNDFATWRAYENRYWPAKYFIDKKGNIRHEHFGEGEYEESERIIQYLLEEGTSRSSNANDNAQAISDIKINGQSKSNSNVQSMIESGIRHELTPETYLGYQRAERFVNASQLVKDATAPYAMGTLAQLAPHEWSLSGKWEVGGEQIMSKSNNSKLTLRFSAREVYLVVDAPVPVLIGVHLNGGVQKSIPVSGAKLYTIASLSTYATGQLLELTVPTGVSLHAFTFGE